MLNMRTFVFIVLLSFGIIGLTSNTSYASCEQQEEMIKNLTKQALLYKDRLNFCQQESTTLQQEKEALSKELDETRQELEGIKEKLRSCQTDFHFSIVGIIFAAGVGLLAGVFLTVKTKNDARQRNQ